MTRQTRQATFKLWWRNLHVENWQLVSYGSAVRTWRSFFGTGRASDGRAGRTLWMLFRIGNEFSVDLMTLGFTRSSPRLDSRIWFPTSEGLLRVGWSLFGCCSGSEIFFLVKTLGFTKFITKEKVSFEFPTSTVLLPYKDNLLRVGRSLIGCCSGSEMCFVLSGLKTISFTRLLPRKRFRFEFPTSKVRLSNIGHLLRAGRLLFGCCPDSEMGLCSIWFQNNWLHKVHNHKKVSFSMFSNFRHPLFCCHTRIICCVLAGHCLDAVQDRKCVFVLSGRKQLATQGSSQGKVLIFISDIQFLLPNEIDHFLAVNFHSVPRTAAARAERSADMSTSSSSLPSASSWVASASGTSAAGCSVTLCASRHRYARVSNLDTSDCQWCAFWRPYFLWTQTRQVTDDQWKAFH